MSVTVEQFAELSNLVIAAALEPGRWQDVADALSRAVGPQVCTQIIGYDTHTNSAPLAVASGYDPDILKLYQEHYHLQNPYAVRFEDMRVGDVVPAAMLCNPNDMIRTAFYSDLLRPMEDIYCGGGTLLFREKGRVFVFGGNMRAKDQDRYEDTWLSLCANIAPVMRQSLEVNRMIAGLSFENWALSQHNLGSQTALVLIDPNCRIHYASAEAERMLQAGDVMKTGLSGKLQFACEEVHHTITQQNGSQTARCGSVVRSLAFESDRGQRWTCRSIGVDLSKLDWSPFGNVFNQQGPALLIALKPETCRLDVNKMIQSALGLSEMEADTALYLAEGMTAAEIAESREVSIHTVRNQIKAALSKCGCRRQADLVIAVDRLRTTGAHTEPLSPIT
ncbi:helix-turn-helix transcriptional regulator [Roseibium sp.]|uniref:helix-turn-helix transcriptional regulator n=1 Tax=Roseibium sp. TaxID=1936156 RepID=UPI003D0CD311